MSNYDKYEKKCPYYIKDGIIYYPSPCTPRVYSRQMTDEIDRIINTLRPVKWKSGVKRFEKIIYENELVSINQYVIGHEPFKLLPPYPSGKEIIRWHGNVPCFDKDGNPVKQPTYASKEYAAYKREQRKRDEQSDAQKERRQRRLQYLREYAHKRYQQKKQQNQQFKNQKQL